jgi:hypothetical protein
VRYDRDGGYRVSRSYSGWMAYLIYTRCLLAKDIIVV